VESREQQLSYLQQAIAQAIDGVEAHEGGPFGAVIVHDGSVIARGRNRVTSLPDATAHAEVEAIRQACAVLGTHSLAGCELYASCEPCPMCLGAIHWARIERVYYAATRWDAAAAGFDDARLHEQLAGAQAQRSVELVHVAMAGAEAPFEIWARLEDRTLY
jgi:guanine deaminase